MSPPSPKLELDPDPAPTVPASRSDLRTFVPDAAGGAVAAFGVHSELNLLPLPTSIGRSSFVDSPQTLRADGSGCSGIIQIEPSGDAPDAASDGCSVAAAEATFGVEFSQMLGEKLGDWGCCGWDGSRTAVAHGLEPVGGGGGESLLA